MLVLFGWLNEECVVMTCRIFCKLLVPLCLSGLLVGCSPSADGGDTTTASTTITTTNITGATDSAGQSTTAAESATTSTTVSSVATATTATTNQEPSGTDSPADNVLTYKNPVISATARNTWRGYGVGDPFVMRWNGRYYLYCSTKDGSTGIQCWVSDNLITWSFAGMCATQALIAGAYAPEVVYYNGYFYMYTSPSGNGHYVLKSLSPLGPFVAVTDNVGLSIDGDVFIDDDGKWFFYHAGINGIVAHPMTAPDKIDANTAITTGSYMNGWTEGSAVLKYNGWYYMTYCGNHVWCHGYRINYGVSHTSPTGFTPAANNPVLISTSDEMHGIGHNSLVLAPDLDGYYMVYHSYTTVPMRQMNIDRVVLNGPRMDILGPTTTQEEAPAMPAVYSRFETAADLENWTVRSASINKQSLSIAAGGRILSKRSFGDRYTAEFNLLSIEGKAGAVFGYTNEQNFGSACYDVVAQKLVVSFTVNGKKTEKAVAVSGSFGEQLRGDALILLSVRRSGTTYTFFMNNRQVYSCESALGGGTIGVTALSGKAEVGFVGCSDHALQSAVKELHKPVEGILPAVTCTNNDPVIALYNDVSYVRVSAGEQLCYKTNVSTTATYDLSVVYRSTADTVLAVYQNNTAVGQITLKASPAADGTALARGLSLTTGQGEIRFRVVSGAADILSYTFREAVPIQRVSFDFSSDMAPAYSDGQWSVDNGVLTMTSEYGKYLIGNENWGDYTVEATLTASEKYNFGLLVRATEPSSGGLGKNDSVGSDFLRGYFVGLGDDQVFLGKFNYDWTWLTSSPATVRAGEACRLKVSVEGACIRVWVNGELAIDYTDKTDPFLHGMTGFRGHDTHGTADDLSVKPINN